MSNMQKMLDLKEEIRLSFFYLENDNTFIKDFVDILQSIGYNYGKAKGIVEGTIGLDTLSDIELGNIAYNLNTKYGQHRLKLENYFNEHEIEEIKDFKLEEKTSDLQMPLLVKNVVRVATNHWLTIMSVEMLGKLEESNLINYEFQTQREATTKITGTGKVLKSPTVNWDAVDNISEKLLKGEFVPNTLTFNLNNSKISDELDYEFGVLEINDGVESGDLVLRDVRLDIIDGYHRLLGIIKANSIMPLDMNFEIRILDFDKDEARQFIIQEDKRTPINKEYLASMDKTDRVRNIIKSLNTDPRSELRGQIVMDDNILKEGIGFVTFENLYNPINRLWNPKNLIEEDIIEHNIKDFFNLLMGYNFGNEMIKDKRLISSYIYLIKDIEDCKDKTDLMKKYAVGFEDNIELYNDLLEFFPSDAIRLTRPFRNEINNTNKKVLEVLKNE